MTFAQMFSFAPLAIVAVVAAFEAIAMLQDWLIDRRMARRVDLLFAERHAS